MVDWCFVSLLLVLACAWQSVVANFACSNGQFIRADDFCKGNPECHDESDEIYTDSNCTDCAPEHVSCSVGSYTCSLHREYLCNETISCDNQTPCDVGCSSHYRCSDGSCQPRRTVCDGDACNGCQATGEWEDGHGFKCLRNGGECLIPQEMVGDGVKDCDNGDDLCFTENGVLDAKKCFRCLDGSTIVNRDSVCDGRIDCPDLSDECLCQNNKLEICDIIMDQVANKSASGCEVGQFPCDGKCLNRSAICDGKKDCIGAVDESYDHCGVTLKCEDASPNHANQQCRCSIVDCKSKHGILCNGKAECSPLSGSNLPDDECWPACEKPDRTYAYECSEAGETRDSSVSLHWMQCLYMLPSPMGLPNTTHLKLISFDQICDGTVDCPLDQADESEETCPDRFRCRSGNIVSVKREKVCDGVADCDDMSDESNVTCPDRFFCSALGNVKVSVDREHVCDFNVNCDDGRDETNCSFDGRFYCESGSPMFVRARQKFDGFVDCDDWSDECPLHSKSSNENVLSSRYELVSNPFLTAAIWIMGILSVFGNLFVIAGEVVTLRRILAKSDASSSLQANHLLVLNLAIADIIMGLYLIMLGSANAHYSGVYCKHKLDWLSSDTCAGMGALVVISSETSVSTMVLLTSFRLYAIHNPFSSSSRPNYRSVILLLIFVWILSFTLALAPLAAMYDRSFSVSALVGGNPFFESKAVELDEAKEFVGKLLVFGQRKVGYEKAAASLASAASWKDLRHVVEVSTNHSDLLRVEGRFSYYSADSVCIPKLFVTSNDPAWRFSFGITLFNFVSFCFVAFSYLAVYLKSRESALVQNEHSKNQNKSNALQRKILRLVATDFCCWVPISIMAFVNMGGHPIPSTAYAVSAIILLPINSALNPILYSNFLDEYTKKLWQRKTSLNTHHTNVTAMASVSFKLSASTRV